MLKVGLLAGLANLLLGLGLNWAIGALIPTISREYQNTSLFRPWTDPLMMVYFAYPFVLGFALVYLWGFLQTRFTGTPTNKAIQFAKIYFLAATIPGMFISYTSFQISLIMVLSWTLVGFLEAFVAGFIFAKLK